MYQGFIGPVPFMHWFVSSDGEASYLLTELEMFVHVICLWLSGYFACSAFTNKRVGKHSEK